MLLQCCKNLKIGLKICKKKKIKNLTFIYYNMKIRQGKKMISQYFPRIPDKNDEFYAFLNDKALKITNIK